MKRNMKASGVIIKEDPIDNPCSIVDVELCHAPLRTAYNEICSALVNDISGDDFHRRAVFSVKYNLWPDVWVSILFVSCALPRPAPQSSYATHIHRATSIAATIFASKSEQAKLRISLGLNYRSGSKAGTESEHQDVIPIGSSFLV